MKPLIYSILLGLVFTACTDKVIEKPEDLLSENKMVDIYFDIALFNAAKNSGYDKFQEHGIDGKKYLYEKHGIDSMQLVNSGNYYAAKPLVYEKIYERVEERLDSLKREFDKEIGSEDNKDEPDTEVPVDSISVDSINTNKQ